MRSPLTLRYVDISMPKSERLVSAHSGMCALAVSDSATISASAPLIRQENTASVSMPKRGRVTLSTAVVTTSRLSSMIAAWSPKHAAAETGSVRSIPGSGSWSDM